MTDHAAFNSAIARINELTTHTDACSTDPYRPTDDHDFAFYALRSALICLQTNPDDPRSLLIFPDFDTTTDDDELRFLPTMIELLTTIIDYDFSRDAITELALANSLCPLHFCDYAICFDDDDPECAPIRFIHQSHDT
jgi:hypothetical protein